MSTNDTSLTAPNHMTAGPDAPIRDMPPWGMFEVFRVLFIGYMALPLVLVSALMIFFPLISTGHRFLLEQLLPMAGWTVIFAVLMRRYPRGMPYAFGLTVRRPLPFYLWNTGRVILAMVLLMVGVNLVSNALGAPPKNPYQAFSAEELRVLTLFAIITAPLLEELIFRGILQSTLRKNTGSGWTMILTAVIFTLFHNLYFQVPVAMLYVFVLGLILSYFREKTGSVIPGMGGHLFNNLLASGWLVFGAS